MDMPLSSKVYNYVPLCENFLKTSDFLEMFRSQHLSFGAYRIPKDGVDTQLPHLQDEVYVVVHGKAILVLDGQNIPVQQGSIVFVAAKQVHCFAQISEPLCVLVFFSPPESEK